MRGKIGVRPKDNEPRWDAVRNCVAPVADLLCPAVVAGTPIDEDQRHGSSRWEVRRLVDACHGVACRSRRLTDSRRDDQVTSNDRDVAQPLPGSPGARSRSEPRE